MTVAVRDIDFAVDVLKVLLWNQNQATALQTLAEQKQAWYNEKQSQFWKDWERDVFNLDTANRFGLAVWSVVLGVDLSASLDPSRLDKPTFGFGPYGKNFGRGNFGARASTTVTLTNDQARLLLRLRYMQLVARPTVPYINRMLKKAFGSLGTVHVLDPQDMQFIVYVFDFEPGSQIRFMLENFDILPRPSGVGIQYRVLTRKVFGFGRTNENFRNATFATDPEA